MSEFSQEIEFYRNHDDTEVIAELYDTMRDIQVGCETIEKSSLADSRNLNKLSF